MNRSFNSFTDEKDRKDMGPVEVWKDGDGVSPVNRQTPVKTVVSHHTTYVAGNKGKSRSTNSLCVGSYVK